MIGKSELLKGRDSQYPDDYTQEISDNLDKLLIPMNQIRSAWNKPMSVTSGWRPPSVNAATPGAAPKSKHMIGLACDISDPDGSLMSWILDNLELMQQLNLYFEDFDFTPNWCHFQLGAPRSGKRIFIPSAAAAPAPGRWSGKYDSRFDSSSA